MNNWQSAAPPARFEPLFGDRVVRCYRHRPDGVWAMLESAAQRNPDGEALVDGDRRLRWKDVLACTEALSAGLAARGVTSGDRVGLFLDNGAEFPLLLFACARIGAIAVPLSHRSVARELRYQLAHSGARLLIHDARLAGELPEITELPLLEHRIGITPGPQSLDALLGAKPLPASPGVGEQTALLLYTSGTTGHPKGAMITQMGLVHAAMTYEHCMELTGHERTIVAVPMSHVTGIAATLMTPLRLASTVVIMRAFKAAEFLALAARERMTHTVIVPAMYQLCLLQPDFAEHDLSSWRIGAFGGAPMAPATIGQLARVLPGLRLMNCYGATETVLPVAIMPPDQTAAHPQRVGHVVPCAEMIIVGDDGRELPDGEQGEIWIRGPSVVRGYWNDPEATQANFSAGFWHSGDIGSKDPDGRIGLHDRKKDMINRGGYKIFSIEVENVLMAFPGVVEAAVVGKPCPVLGERVHAFVSSTDSHLTAERLRAHCAAVLADYKVPESFTLGADLLPRNTNGKLLKREMRDRLLGSPRRCI